MPAQRRTPLHGSTPVPPAAPAPERHPGAAWADANGFSLYAHGPAGTPPWADWTGAHGVSLRVAGVPGEQTAEFMLVWRSYIMRSGVLSWPNRNAHVFVNDLTSAGKVLEGLTNHG